MKLPYPIIQTNARQGRALSHRNRPRRGRLTPAALIIGLAAIILWIGAALVISRI